MTASHESRPPHRNWGRWGAEDERRALNLVDDGCTVAAVKVCRTGKTYSLSLPIQRFGVPQLSFRGPAQRLSLTGHTDERMLRHEPGVRPGVGAAEDVLVLPSHSVTQVDALSHVYADHSLFNGRPYDDASTYNGAERCGIETMIGVATRGVLIDVAAFKQVDYLTPGHVITPGEIDATLDWEDLELRPGDVAMVRTGWVEWFMDRKEMSMEKPGIGVDAAIHIGDQDVAAIGADNTSAEAMPFDRGQVLGAHIEVLVKRGVFMSEHLKLDELAADRCYECLFTMGPLLSRERLGVP